MSFPTAFDDEENRHRSFYGNEQPCLGDRSIWYSDTLHFLFTPEQRASFPCPTVRPLGWGDTAPYWTPRADLHAHMRWAAEREKSRLVLVTPDNGKHRNPNFHRFPVAYGLQDPSLAHYAIDDTVRVASMADGVLTIERANYLDQLATNIQPDEKPAGWTQSLREAARVDGRLSPLDAANPLANTLGTGAMLVDRDGVPLLRFRGRPDAGADAQGEARLAVMARGWHCAASGVTRWQDLCWEEPPADRCPASWLWRGLERAMWRELEEETGLTAADGLVMTPLAWVRELKRAGKPNVFFVIHAPDASCEDLQGLITSRAPVDGDEYTTDHEASVLERIVRVLRKQGTSAFLADRRLALGQLDTATPVPSRHYTYEAYAGLRLAARWWQHGRPRHAPEARLG